MHVAGHKQRPPLHLQERWFLGIVLLQLVFLPWAFGTMHGWSQMVSLGFGVLGLGVALLPRRYDDDALLFAAPGGRRAEDGGQKSNARSQEFILRSRPRLLKFPVFWLGLLLLGCIALQGFNPSWVWERNDKFRPPDIVGAVFRDS